MTIEAATYIADLNITYPEAGSSPRDGDDHLRIIKSVLKNSFPQVTAAVTTSALEFNYLVGVTSAVQTQLNAKQTSDATLTALAAMPDARGAELAALSAFMGGMLNDADAATARVTLEVDQLAHWAWDSVRGRVPRTLTAGTSFDGVLTPGVYNLDTTGSTSAPPGLISWCYIDVYRFLAWEAGTNDFITQVVRTMNGAGSLPRIWTRTYTQGSGWSNWFSLLHQRVWSGDVKASYPRDTTFSGSGIAYDRAVRLHTVNNAVGGHTVSATVDGVSIGVVGTAESSNDPTHVMAQFIVPAYKSWSWTANATVTVQSLYILG